MSFCDKCLNLSDNTGYTVSERLKRAGEYCQKGPAGGNDAMNEVDRGLSTLQSKGGCSSCVAGMKAFKSKLESMM